MKKALALTLVLLLSLSLLAGCGGEAASSSMAASTATSTAASGGDSSMAQSMAEATAGIPKEDLLIGVIHILDPADQGYTYNHDLGVQYMCEQLGIDYETQTIPKFNIDDTDVAATNAAINELVGAGCNLIFATSFSYGTQITEAARQHPDIEFCHATGFEAHFADLPNLHNYFAKIHQARYLSGIVAGLKAKEIGNPKLGYIAAFPYAEVISGFTAFYLGAKSVYEDVTMDVIYINSWGDAIIEAEVAQTLIDRGCGVISQHSDNVSPATVAESNGAFHVGYNNDMIPAAPNAALISSRINWGIYMTEAAQAVIDGTPIPLDWSQGLESGAAYLSPLNEDIAAEGTMEAVEAAQEEILNGMPIFSGALVDNDGNPSVITDFEGNEIYTFTDEDSVFIESEGNSAPAFNASVAGIFIVS